MNIDKLLKHVCKSRGITLDSKTLATLKKDILGEDIHLNNVIPVINVKLDKVMEAHTEQQSKLFNKVFKATSSDHDNCPVCKQVMSEVILANDRKTEFCKKCKVVMPTLEKTS